MSPVIAKLLPELLEWLGLAGIVSLFAFIAWTKMALGAVLCFLGAFYNPRFKRSERGEGTVRASSQFFVKFKGGLRFCVVFGGIILLIGSVVGASDRKREHDEREEANREKFRAEWTAELIKENVRKLELLRNASSTDLFSAITHQADISELEQTLFFMTNSSPESHRPPHLGLFGS